MSTDPAVTAATGTTEDEEKTSTTETEEKTSTTPASITPASTAPTSTTPTSRWERAKAWSSKTKTQASKKYVKAKAATAAKRGVEPTAEEPDTLRAIERLKQTKLEVTDLTKAARGMLEGARAHARHCLGFATAASTVRVDHGDKFALMTRQMGEGFQFIDSSLQENLELLSEKVVAPMEKFLNEIEAVNQLKWEYTAFKNTYDSAFHKVKKAKENPSTSPEKQADLDSKATAKKMQLDVLRSAFIAEVNALELRKQTILYMDMETFWTRYLELQSYMSMSLAALKRKEADAKIVEDLQSETPVETVAAERKPPPPGAVRVVVEPPPDTVPVVVESPPDTVPVVVESPPDTVPVVVVSPPDSAPVVVVPPPVPPPAAAEDLNYPAFQDGFD